MEPNEVDDHLLVKFAHGHDHGSVALLREFVNFLMDLLQLLWLQPWHTLKHGLIGSLREQNVLSIVGHDDNRHDFPDRVEREQAFELETHFDFEYFQVDVREVSLVESKADLLDRVQKSKFILTIADVVTRGAASILLGSDYGRVANRHANEQIVGVHCSVTLKKISNLQYRHRGYLFSVVFG